MSEDAQKNRPVECGDSRKEDDLLPLVYEELRKVAAFKMASLPAGQTFQPTELVHEAWMRINKNGAPQFAGRTHFFATAAEAMRHIIIDRVRRKKSQRHGGNRTHLDIESIEVAAQADGDELLAVDEVLDKLAAEEPQKAEVVKLRYFAGMTFEETAAALDISVATAKRHWAYARAWLHAEIHPDKAD